MMILREHEYEQLGPKPENHIPEPWGQYDTQK